MDRILRQFERLISDDGRADVDFTDQEARLKQAQQRLAGRTRELARAAENLNRAALSVGFPAELKH